MARRKSKLPQEKFVLFPNYEPKRNDAGSISGAVYYISNHGAVRRVDSSVEYDPKNPTFDIDIKPTLRGTTLNVKIAGGSSTRSLPKAVADVFATKARPRTGDIYGRWVPIIHPETPKVDGVPRCTVIDIVWAPYSESTYWARGQREPEANLMIPILAPVK